MSWLLARVYDRMMAAPEEACLRTWRAELLAGVAGEVLEIGAGTGASLAAYGAGVSRLVLSEPDPAMRRQLEVAVTTSRPDATVVSAPAHALPLPDASFDVVASFLVLCSVADVRQTLAELRRVLRPQGRLVFLEHVAAEANPRRLAWQRRVTPLWRLAAGNCHLARDTASAIEGAGFVVEELQRASIRKAMPLARPSIRGWARRA